MTRNICSIYILKWEIFSLLILKTFFCWYMDYSFLTNKLAKLKSIYKGFLILLFLINMARQYTSRSLACMFWLFIPTICKGFWRMFFLLSHIYYYWFFLFIKTGKIPENIFFFTVFFDFSSRSEASGDWFRLLCRDFQ